MEKEQPTANAKVSSTEYSLETLKEAYGNIHVTKKRFLLLSWYHVWLVYDGKQFSFNYIQPKSEKDLYEMVNSKIEALERNSQKNEEKSSSQNQHRSIKYDYRKKRGTHVIVHRMWESNVKTVDTVRNSHIVKHEVLPDSASEVNFTVQPYKKKKKHWWQ